MKHPLKLSATLLVAVLFLQILFSSLAAAKLSIPLNPFSSSPSSEPLSYHQLMRQINAFEQTSSLDKSQQNQTINQLKKFIATEKDKLTLLNVPVEKQKPYLEFLKQRLVNLESPAENLSELSEPTNQILKPDQPARFAFNNQPVQINRFNISQRISRTSIPPEAMPVLEDVLTDGQEVIINEDIKNLAASLDNNPVNITNYIREHIIYEPYYGSKKGALGCLTEKICNDVDTSSLTISLLRAAGIPARYKKSIIVVPVEQLQNFLGVDETKTVYAAFYWNEVPVYTITGNISGEDFEEADFSNETHLALEWVFVEAFYEYDERGGNLLNSLDLSGLENTGAIRDVLAEYPKKRWIPIETAMQDYTHTANEIVHDSAGLNSLNFWENYLQYQGTLNPLEKYRQDLQSTTGKDIFQALYQSTKTSSSKIFDLLPPTLPYQLAIGEIGGQIIEPENWSALPAERKHQVKISLENSDTQEVIIEETFSASEINNQPIDLLYVGATETDQAIIDNYGGIYLTPAALVDLKPIFQTPTAHYETTNTVAIGDQLVLHFEYLLAGNIFYEDEKFSTAGNQEGIFIVFSKVAEDSTVDDPNDPKQNAKILMGGNPAIARQYLKRLNENGQTFKKSLDIEYNLNFSRAVVTQNRIMNRIQGLPTTFDFKGLTIDASTYINSYSNRGLYRNHIEDFHLLWGLQASYDEARIFEDITGLEAISTVKGLQYAYAHPAEYTVHRITSANESVIDGLALSENTKQNMHTDVQDGRTIYTPDQLISSGNWYGLFYVSLEEDGTGLYAIGEQTQSNGGWSTSELINYLYTDQYGLSRDGYWTQQADYHYYYEDKDYDGVQCFISQTDYDTIINHADWSYFYGYPCLIDEVTFGPGLYGSASQVHHSYIFASNGTYFFRSGHYDYWEYRSTAQSKINQYVDNLPRVDEKYNFRFSPTLGTYLQGICTEKGWRNCENDEYVTVYYTPYQSGSDHGRVYRLQKGFLDEASKDDNALIKMLGFPTSDEADAATSPDHTNGVYQNFANGQFYYHWRFTLPLPQIYPTYGKTTETHNNNGGTLGSLGFPIDEPIEENNIIYQSFEGNFPNRKEIVWDLQNNSTTIIPMMKFRCERYGFLSATGADDFLLKFIEVIGILDTGVATIDSFIQMGDFLYQAATDPEIQAEIKAIYEELKNLNLETITGILRDASTQLYEALINEYEHGSCPARQTYLKGRIKGEILLLLVPATELSKLKLVEKLKNLNAFIKIREGLSGIKYLVKASKIGKAIVKRFPKGESVFDRWITKALKNADWTPNAHHIVPKSFRNGVDAKYRELIASLDDIWGGAGKFDLNEGYNGIMLPKKLHPGDHLGSYKEEIWETLSRKVSEGANKDEIIEEINNLRNRILDGELKPNNSWDEISSQEFIEELQNTRYIYQ